MDLGRRAAPRGRRDGAEAPPRRLDVARRERLPGERERRVEPLGRARLRAELERLERAAVVPGRLGVRLQAGGLARGLERQLPRGLGVGAAAGGGERMVRGLGGRGLAAGGERLLQHGGGRRVQAPAHVRRELVVDRVAHDRVGEAEAARRVQARLHEAAGQRRLERERDRLAAEPADPRHAGDRERAADTPAIASTSRVAGSSGSRRRPTTSRTRSGTSAGSSPRGRPRHRVPRARRGPRAGAPARAGRAGCRRCARAGTRSAAGATAAPGGRKRPTADAGRPCSAIRTSRRRRSSSSSAAASGWPAGTSAVAVGEHDDHARVGHRGQHVAEQRERGAVGGVQVLERDEQQPLARGRADQGDDRVEHAQARLLAARRAGGELGHAAVAGQPAQLVEHRRREPAGRGHQRAQRAAPRTVGARLLARAPAHDRRAAGARLGGGLVGDARLADPRLPRHRDRDRAPARGAVQRGAQPRELLLAADERLAVGGDGGDRDARRAAEPVERVAHGGGARRADPRAAWPAGRGRAHRARAATPGTCRDGGSGGAARCCASSTAAFAPSNGGRPHRSSHSVAPSA